MDMQLSLPMWVFSTALRHDGNRGLIPSAFCSRVKSVEGFLAIIHYCGGYES